MPFTVIATADLHLGRNSSRLPAHKQRELGPALNTLPRIKKAVFEHKADALVMAGDIFDAHNHFFDSYNELTKFFGELLQTGIHIIMTAGNHDYNILSEFVSYWNPPESSAMFRLLGGSGSWESVVLENDEGSFLEVAGWSFTSRYRQEDPLQEFPETLFTTEAPRLVLVHGDADQPESVYAPLSTGTMNKIKADAWILGHIHKPATLSQAHPFIAYPGSPQPLSPKETGEHALLLLEFETAEKITTAPVSPSTLIYKDIEIPLTDNLQESELRSFVMEELQRAANLNQFCIARLILSGRHHHLDAIKELADELARNENMEPYIQQVDVRVQPAIRNIEILTAETNPAGVVAGALSDLKNKKPNALLEEWRSLLKQKQREIVNSRTYAILDEYSPDETDETDGKSNKEMNKPTEILEQHLWDMLYTLQKQKIEAQSG